MIIKKNKFCRREGENLEFFSGKKFFLKIRSLLTPGEHGVEKGKFSDYGMVLRIKQKIKRYYILSEKKFKLIYKKISKNFFFCEDLVNFLERRLDNVLYRMNFSLSRKNSRQSISHGFVYVNFKKIRFSSFIVSPGDSIYIENFLKLNFFYNYNFFYKFNWLIVDYFKGKGIFIFLPNYFKFNFNKNIILDIYK